VATGPIAPPGSYSARITVEGKTFTQPFKVLKDADVKTSDADLLASTQAQVRIRDDITTASEMVNRMEIWRKQIEDQLKAPKLRADVSRSLKEIDQTILDVERKLVSRSEMLSDDKYFPEAYKVYMNLIWLSGGVGMGASDEAGSIDYRPTDTQLQVLEVIEKDLGAARSAFENLEKNVLPGFNKTMSGRAAAIGGK